jgi:hypothetical protein
MKLLTVFLAAGLSLPCLSLEAADLSGVKSVYLMPMSGGLDQYLAIRLTNGGDIHVVTDPKKADAIFTDRIGANFEQSLQDMYAEKKKPSEDGKISADDFARPTSSPGARGKGSLFLVDRQSRVVLWSTFATAKTTTADDLNHLATKIVEQLSKDRGGKDQKTK